MLLLTRPDKVSGSLLREPTLIHQAEKHLMMDLPCHRLRPRSEHLFARTAGSLVAPSSAAHER